ncbi:MAG TPA: hypothetical protein VIY48_00070 [Candidatus Paceibacterota bacterium]
MNKEIAELWTEALRSGDYDQATGTLVSVDGSNGEIVGYCCLGVLCDLAVSAGVAVEYEGPKKHVGEYDPTDPEDVYWTGVKYDSSDALLPMSVMNWAGMGANDGSWGDSPDSLAVLNDAGFTFDRIARIINKNVEAL